MSMVLDRRRVLQIGGLIGLAGAVALPVWAKTRHGLWDQFRARFLSPEGRIVDNGNGGISHSEGQGYGLLFAWQAGDRNAFAAMARWTGSVLARSDTALHAWRYDPVATQPVADSNNATDGDLLIAWALSMAGRDWDIAAYRQRSADIRGAIRRECVVERDGRHLLLPGRAGFVEPQRVVLNPSYFVWPALDAFAKLDGEDTWRPVIADAMAVVALARFGPHRLPSDWIELTGADAVAPAKGWPPRFGFDAIRVPLYAAMGGRLLLVADIAAFWRGRVAQAQALPAWVDVTSGEEAAYPLSPGGQSVASRLLGLTLPADLSADYYAAALQMLAATPA